MKKHMYFWLPLLAILIGLNAYQYVNAYEMRENNYGSRVVANEAIYSDELEALIAEEDAPTVLLPIKHGPLAIYDKHGNGPVKLKRYKKNVLYECVAPGEDSEGLVCKGLSGKEPIKSIETVTVIQSGSNTCITKYRGDGKKYEYCW